MKKIKNDVLKENYSSLKLTKEGKILKNKLETVSRLKGAVGKTTDFMLAPKIQSSNLKENYVNADRPKSKSILQKPAKNIENKITKLKYQSKSKDVKNQLENNTVTEENIEAVRKKIEKKKAKKLAQKLRKKQKKAQNRDFEK
ncbi:hypothetical protein EVAR_72917_1 [Eumeta japonica]|uniref:Uncharacterized protein n=1 Tax=Eumeta variegata TaxID=151549 RepID=A0A4C1SUT6_EUMVA|nr:hypothetical protein EVAR_72917_1 [Eumeta japonica]